MNCILQRLPSDILVKIVYVSETYDVYLRMCNIVPIMRKEHTRVQIVDYFTEVTITYQQVSGTTQELRIYEFQDKIHREYDKPAIEWSDGEMRWTRHGKLHRDNDLPAVITNYNTKMWYIDGKLHRENDQPAIENANGNREWHVHGVLHRENDQPAILYKNLK